MESQPLTSGTLVDRLREHARAQGERRAFTFLRDGEEEEASFSYAELDQRARTLAARLQAEGAAGERALLLYPSGLEFIAGFMACLYAGTVAVPVHVPRGRGNLERIDAVVRQARPRFALTTGATLPRLAPLAAEIGLESLRCFATDAWPTEAGPPAGVLPPSEALAFLQYTSGSTADPKGVMVTHGNLMANHAMLQEGFEQDGNSTIVVWLPLFHDMGLIGHALQAIYLGSHAVVMAPEAFLVKPVRWLRAISKYRGHSSGGPNFGFEHCVRRVPEEQLSGLDLSSWKTAFNGAESVRASTLRGFAERFAPAGFRPEALVPCYGLAEATLFVAGGVSGHRPCTLSLSAAALEEGRVELAAPGEASRELVSCGRGPRPAEVAIVHPGSGRPCRAEEVGEVWLRGPHVGRGYWEQPAATAETFGACLAGAGEVPFLRTGDLGMLHEGELYLAGRIKELIIIAGRNHYPADLEQTVERSHPALHPGGAAAFAFERDGEECLAIVAEISRTARREVEPARVQADVQAALSEHHGLRAEAVVLLAPGTLPRTTSGKTRRTACRAIYLAEALPLFAPPAAPAPRARKDAPGIEEWLRARIAAQLRLAPAAIDATQPIARLGLDSLALFALTGDLAQWLDRDLPAWLAWKHPTLAQMAEYLAATASLKVARQADRGAPLRLSLAQEEMWKVARGERHRRGYQHVWRYTIRGALDVPALERSFCELVRRHEILRTSFPEVEGAAAMAIRAAGTSPLHVEDLSAAADFEASATAVEEAAAAQLMDLGQGPLFQAWLLCSGRGQYRLGFSLHHLLFDAHSISLLQRELAVLYGAFSTAHPSPLPELPGQMADFCAWEQHRLDPAGELYRQQIRWWSEYWREPLRGGGGHFVFQRRKRPAALDGEANRLTATLPAALSFALREQSSRLGLTLNAVLFAAYAAILHQHSRADELAIGLNLSNRGGLGMRGLIGYFINRIVLRSTARAGSFRESAAFWHAHLAEAGAHGEVPWPQVAATLKDERRAIPEVNAAFQFSQVPGGVLQLPGLEVESLDRDSARAQMPWGLSVTFLDLGGPIDLRLGFRAQRYEPAGVAAMFARLLAYLEQIAADPGAPLPRRLPPPRRRFWWPF